MTKTLDVREQIWPEQLSSGMVLNDRYQLIARIGSGTYGEVWKAQDLVNKHLEVAVKLSRSELSSPEVRERFARECSALELLMPHRHIVAIRNRGVYQDQDYMVLELLNGQRLSDWIGRHSDDNLPSLTQVLDLFAQICIGVAAAHQVQSPGPIVHRDLKPENVMLVPDPNNLWSGQTVKLLDFGLARLGDLRRTLAGQQLGTPLYMAPEQMDGNEAAIGPWTDIYSLGVILVELLTLRPTGPEESSLRGLVERSGPRGLRHHLQHVRSDLPNTLCQIILKALAPQPAARFPDAHALLCELRTAFPWLDTGLHSSSENLAILHRPRWRTTVTTAMVVVSVAVFGHVLSPRVRSQLPAVVALLLRWGSHDHRLPVSPPRPGANPTPPGAPPVSRSGGAAASPLVELGGTQFLMGSTAMEVQAAQDWCRRQLGPLGARECPLETFNRESPRRRVYVSRYAIEKTEVSNRQLAAWLNAQKGLQLETEQMDDHTEIRWVVKGKERWVDLFPTLGMVRGLSYRDGRYQAEPGTEDMPAVQVSWYAANAYCQSIGRRLPTEAEWEYAARTDKQQTFPWGAADPSCEGVVIARDPGDNCFRVGENLRPVDVATQDRTREGVLNLGGNVAEWVMDAFEPSYRPCPDPCKDPVVSEHIGGAAAAKNLRVFRGGSWSLPLATARGATRSRAPAATTAQTIGFRCAVSR